MVMTPSTRDSTPKMENPKGYSQHRKKRNVMPNRKWVTMSFKDSTRSDKDLEELIIFWNSFYSYLKENKNSESKTDTKSSQYKEHVFDILYHAKGDYQLCPDDLRKIQLEIEDITMKFDEKSIFKSSANILNILIKKNEVSAKDYLLNIFNKSEHKDILELIEEFGHYTIEAIIVYVLSMVSQHSPFSETSMIRAATLPPHVVFHSVASFKVH